MTELDKLLAARDVATTVDNYSTTQSKIDLLEQKRQEKLDKLGSNKQYTNLSDGHTIMPGGNLESNSNKIWNNLNDIELQYMLGYAAGDTSDSSRADEARRLYLYNTKQGNSKGGVSTGAADTSDVRYDNTIDPRYTQPWRRSGEDGPDLNNKMMDAKLDFAGATVAEGLLHGNERLLDKRKYPDYLSDEALLHDGGVSEYYKGPVSELLGNASNQTLTPERELELQNMYEEYKQLPGAQPRRYGNRPEATPEVEVALQNMLRDTGPGAEIREIPKAVAAALGKGAVELVDAVESLGSWGAEKLWNKVTGRNDKVDLITPEDKKAMISKIDEAVGYDREADQKTLIEAKETLDKLGIDILDYTTWDKVTTDEGRKALAKIAGDMISNPSLSLGMFAEIVGSGGAAGTGMKVAGKIGSKVAPKLTAALDDVATLNRTRVNQQIRDLNKTAMPANVRAAEMANLEKQYTLGKKAVDIVKGSTMVNADMAVRINNHIEEFKANNNGEGPDGLKLISMVLLDKIAATAEVGSMKTAFTPAGKLKPGVEGAIRSTVTDYVKKVIPATLEEMVQEGFDSVLDVINTQYGTDKYKGKTLGELISENTADILTGATAGAFGGIHATSAMHGLKAGKAVAVDTASGLQNIKERIDDRAQAKAWASEDLKDVMVSTFKADKETFDKLEATTLEMQKALNKGESIDNYLGKNEAADTAVISADASIVGYYKVGERVVENMSEEELTELAKSIDTLGVGEITNKYGEDGKLLGDEGKGYTKQEVADRINMYLALTRNATNTGVLSSENRGSRQVDKATLEEMNTRMSGLVEQTVPEDIRAKVQEAAATVGATAKDAFNTYVSKNVKQVQKQVDKKIKRFESVKNIKPEDRLIVAGSVVKTDTGKAVLDFKDGVTAEQAKMLVANVENMDTMALARLKENASMALENGTIQQGVHSAIVNAADSRIKKIDKQMKKSIVKGDQLVDAEKTTEALNQIKNKETVDEGVKNLILQLRRGKIDEKLNDQVIAELVSKDIKGSTLSEPKVKSLLRYLERIEKIAEVKPDKEATQSEEVKAKFENLDVTKEYKEEEIRDVVEDMLKNPEAYPQTPETQQFVANNVGTINKVAEELDKAEEAAKQIPVENQADLDINDGLEVKTLEKAAELKESYSIIKQIKDRLGCK